MGRVRWREAPCPLGDLATAEESESNERDGDAKESEELCAGQRTIDALDCLIAAMELGSPPKQAWRWKLGCGGCRGAAGLKGSGKQGKVGACAAAGDMRA